LRIALYHNLPSGGGQDYTTGMNILMVNRSNAYEVSGGDVVQMGKTANALTQLGMRVTIRLINQLQDEDGRYDLIHIFNIQTAEESQHALEWARGRGFPVALSPIYWDPLPAWFGDSDNLRSFWRRVKCVLGYHLGLEIYARWQRHRFPAQRQWQIQRTLLLAADIVLPNSWAEARVLVRDFRLPKSWLRSVQVVPNAIDEHLFINDAKLPTDFLETTGGPGYVLEVGRVSPEKNNLALIKALWNVDIPIVFVGQPSPYHPDYVAKCRDYGQIRGNVHFFNQLPHDQLPAVYRHASVHALPSWRETPGLVSLEAAAAGCNVVTTTIGSAHEYLGDRAWYCHPASERSIRRAVLAAREAPKNDSLQHHVLSRFTWAKAAQATLDGYQRVITDV